MSDSPPAAGFFQRLTRLQLERPVLLLLGTLVMTALALLLAARLELHTALGELLPRGKESVIVADQVGARLPAISNVTIVGEGSDNRGLERFVDALVPELRKIDPKLVGQVDGGVHAAHQFLKEHQLLYAPLSLVRDVHDQILERYEYEVAKKAGTLLDEDDPPPEISEASIRQRIQARTATAGSDAGARSQEFPGGYYLDEKRHHVAVRVLTPLASGDLVRTEQLKSAIWDAVKRVGPERFDPKLKIGLTGNLLTGAEAYTRIKGDLSHVGVWGVTGILIVGFLFYLRVRTVVAMALAVGVGTSWAFGLAYLLVGHLNSSTGFLFSIIVGNGINFGIIYMARYLEARRDSDVESSLRVAHRETWSSTLTAAAAASAAYGSLAATDFRGFKQFGLIGGSGMLLCWLSTFLVLPVILVLWERVRPVSTGSGVLARASVLYGRPFAWVVLRFPRLVIALSIVFTLASAALTYRYVAADPMEYNMRTLDNVPSDKPTEVRRLAHIADHMLGKLRQDGLAIAVDRLDQVLPLKAALEARRKAAQEGKKPFENVVTIFSLLPSDQPEKIKLIGEARETLERARRRNYIADRDWEKIEQLFPAGELKPIEIADLPEQMAAPFAEKDGTRGRLVYIVPTKDASIWDGHYLIRMADSFRRTELPDGSLVRGSGRMVIFADVILSIVENAPRAMLVSLFGTLAVVLLAFRRRADSLWVVGSLLVGLLWTIGILSVWNSSWDAQHGLKIEGIKLNFLNFVALPITIGVGVDYAVNVMQRYRLASGDLKRVIIETGGAVVLCSLTTMVGYLALTLSINGAIRSFGIAAALGEVCCVLTGVLVLPAILHVLKGRPPKAQ